MTHSVTNFHKQLRDPIYRFLQTIGFQLQSGGAVVIN